MRNQVISAILFILISCQPKQQSNISELKEEPRAIWIDLLSEQLNYSLRTAESKSKEIRLWVNYEVFNICEMHSLKNTTSSSILTHHYMWSDLENSYLLDSAVLSFDEPRISTDQLITRIYELGFRELGNQPDSIATRIGDGISYHLELRDSTYYKVIRYNIPHYFDDVNGRAFMSIVAELESGLNWKYNEKL